ncbi:MAG: isoprenyl transferase [Xenococcaceae cyanobacterium MO_167.B52]|nr:isoprenyl transferase [Xenococcaceae cyanobacterium MO_167.B52]
MLNDMSTKLISTRSRPINIDYNKLPQHIAIIMDGNGRWAKQQGLPRIEGHLQGVNALKEILRACKNWGIRTLTVYAFSTENWGRPLTEVSFLMNLFERFIKQELEEMQQEGVCLKFIGDLSALPLSLQQVIEHSMAITQHNQGINFNVAINYGGRDEIVKACRSIAEKVARQELLPETINADLISQHLDTANNSDPDLLIRTSGEMRLSNFLLWQIAYTEIYVTDTFWPDFAPKQLEKAIVHYQKRDRRFGKIK